MIGAMMSMLTLTTMQTHHPPHINPTHFSNSDKTRVVAFTTPSNYAARLRHVLQLKGWTPLWCPTVVVEPSRQTRANLRRFLLPQIPNGGQGTTTPLEDFSAIAFTSRAGITAFAEALSEIPTPKLAPVGEILTIAALGRDSELLHEGFVSRICGNPKRIRVLVPPTATPAAMAESLGAGRGRKVLCPAPLVVDLEEPPVVPDFLRDLAARGWIPTKVDAYETRWAGRRCAEGVVGGSEEEGLDAIVFTSTGEVEGLLKSLTEIGLDWGTMRRRCPRLVVAAHGPVTAAGAERLGVGVDVVSSRFESFHGVVDALARRWHRQPLGADFT